MANIKPNLLFTIMNTCPQEAMFLTKWKVAKLVLLHKGLGKLLTEHSSFRSISMLYSCGKLLKRMILDKINNHLDETPSGQSKNQFCFRRGKSRTDVINKIMAAADQSCRGIVQNSNLCVNL